jgi:hypothetical protein
VVDCNKRQKEVYKGTERYRCIHPESEFTKEVIPEAVCLACPLVKMKILSCKEAQKKAEQEQWIEASRQPKKENQLPVLNLQPGYPECPFRYGVGTAGAQKCSITNLPVDREICGRCDAETRERSASFGEKVVNYFGAIRRWVASGRPTRSQEEIESLFESHCKDCDRYDKDKHACKNCGCSVSTDSEPLGNKLAMETEHCPLGRF